MPDLKDLDLVTSVELTNVQSTQLRKGGKKKECYHFLYGSQLYGTLFGVFGRFKTKPVGTDSLEVQSLSLYLFNYQGLLNIGFANRNPIFQERDPNPDPELHNQKTITIYVRGGSRKLEKTLKFKPGELIVPKGGRTRVIMNRLLFPLLGYGVGKNPYLPLPSPNPKDVLFDTEFQYRNGIAHNWQVIRPGMADKEDELMTNLKFPASRCLHANINLLY